MQSDGNFVIYTKPEPVSKYAKWATNTVKNAKGDYVLVMQNDGNLVIYNNALARNDYEAGLLFGALILRLAVASGASFYQVWWQPVHTFKRPLGELVPWAMS